MRASQRSFGREFLAVALSKEVVRPLPVLRAVIHPVLANARVPQISLKETVDTYEARFLPRLRDAHSDVVRHYNSFFDLGLSDERFTT